MIIKTSDTQAVKKIFKNFRLPNPISHKGQNGKVLIIGGSSLFHAASIWAAEVASHFVDIVHYSSTKENNEIVLSLKKKFINGIVIPHNELEHYVKEDDVILVGPGMVRTERIENRELRIENFKNLFQISNEGEYTYYLTKYLIEHYANKKFVFDAGSLQMMGPEWLLKLKTQPILTPHQIEFERVFGEPIGQLELDDKIKVVQTTAKKYKVVIRMKAIVDIISDGNVTYVVEGGNAGLTKGGTGDVLSGLCASFLSKNKALESALYASMLLKRTADALLKINGYWYNVDTIIEEIPHELKKII
ncbi:NAD(P)H-hydrate dehydratase [Candidatus Roizmanbacteria bacterium]|nr:NAD(P)H-hydrate dehydratase [Candidatus Roizmanbacteria bacterium]